MTGSFDAAGVERAVRDLLVAIGEDPDRNGLRRTPGRVARAYAEQFAGLYVDPSGVLQTTFDEGHEEMVLVKDIEMYSTCEHHLVPFHGVAHVGYIPNPDGRITGLSKLARLVEVYARRPQVQERMTRQIADALDDALKPRGVEGGVHPAPYGRGGSSSRCECRPPRCGWPPLPPGAGPG